VKDQDITWPSQCLHLTGKDLVEAEIIRGRRDQGSVRRQGNRPHRPTEAGVAHHIFRGQMLGIRGAPAVPGKPECGPRIERRAVPLGDRATCLRHPGQGGGMLRQGTKRGRHVGCCPGGMGHRISDPHPAGCERG